MTKAKFKVGQKVICIRGPKGEYKTDMWELGKSFIVHEVRLLGDNIKYGYFFKDYTGGIHEDNLKAGATNWREALQ